MYIRLFLVFLLIQLLLLLLLFVGVIEYVHLEFCQFALWSTCPSTSRVWEDLFLFHSPMLGIIKSCHSVCEFSWFPSAFPRWQSGSPSSALRWMLQQSSGYRGCPSSPLLRYHIYCSSGMHTELFLLPCSRGNFIHLELFFLILLHINIVLPVFFWTFGDVCVCVCVWFM